MEFLDLIEPLSRDYHLVIPSIPGFGFSGPTREAGWTTRRIAAAWAELMRRLGYDRYGSHGGDFGSGISRALGLEAPDNVVRWSDFDRGGHFAAMEAPDLLLGDIREFFAAFR